MRAAAARAALAAPIFAVTALLAVPAHADGGQAPHPTGVGPRRPAPQLVPAHDPDPWLGRDKALHFGASATLAGGGYGFWALGVTDVRGRFALGAAVALGAGIAKEALDAFGLGTPSWRDLTWDLIGTAVGLGLSLTVDFAARPDHF